MALRLRIFQTSAYCALCLQGGAARLLRSGRLSDHSWRPEHSECLGFCATLAEVWKPCLGTTPVVVELENTCRCFCLPDEGSALAGVTSSSTRTWLDVDQTVVGNGCVQQRVYSTPFLRAGWNTGLRSFLGGRRPRLASSVVPITAAG